MGLATGRLCPATQFESELEAVGVEFTTCWSFVLCAVIVKSDWGGLQADYVWACKRLAGAVCRGGVIVDSVWWGLQAALGWWFVCGCGAHDLPKRCAMMEGLLNAIGDCYRQMMFDCAIRERA